MALATNLNALLRVPGRLCANPSDLTQSFPFGGTDLGLVMDVYARPHKVVKRLKEENLGTTVVGGIDLGEAWAIAAGVRALEQGNAAKFGFTVEEGSVSGEPGIVHNPVSNLAGKLITTFALMFAPFDELQQFFVYMPAVIAYPDVAAEMAKSMQRDGVTLVAFDATPRTSDGYAFIARKREDLVLP